MPIPAPNTHNHTVKENQMPDEPVEQTLVHSAPDEAATEPTPMIAAKTEDFHKLLDILDDMPHGYAKKIMAHLNKNFIALQVNLRTPGV
jgi:hypothetical protein